MTRTIISAELRSRRLNLRLVSLPERAEWSNACAFLEKWLPETLGLASGITVEAAHRIGQRKDDNAPPRTLIMKFLDRRDLEKVTKAIKDITTAKKQDMDSPANIMYEGRPVKFFPDLPIEVLNKRKEFNSVRDKLRGIPGIRQGMLFPAKLLVTYKDKTRGFEKPGDVEEFIRRIQETENSTSTLEIDDER